MKCVGLVMCVCLLICMYAYYNIIENDNMIIACKSKVVKYLSICNLCKVCWLVVYKIYM